MQAPLLGLGRHPGRWRDALSIPVLAHLPESAASGHHPEKSREGALWLWECHCGGAAGYPARRFGSDRVTYRERHSFPRSPTSSKQQQNEFLSIVGLRGHLSFFALLLDTVGRGRNTPTRPFYLPSPLGSPRHPLDLFFITVTHATHPPAGVCSKCVPSTCSGTAKCQALWAISYTQPES